jgi:hypothetical protein
LAVDESSLLPNVPPPRPAGRDAAIGAALRRFDGDDAQPVRRGPSGWAWTRHPQAGLALSMSLVAVIGIPAALIAIQERPAPMPAHQEAAKAPAPRPAIRPTVPDVTADAAEDRAPPVSSARPEPNRFPVLPDESARPSAAHDPDAAYAAPAPPLAAAPPAPPPAPMAEPVQRQAVEDHSVVVTGSRIRSPALNSERKEMKAIGRAFEGATAPDWVRNDPEYRTFLGRLQSAVRLNQRSTVAGMIAYPLRVNGGGGTQLYRDRAAVLRDYEEIFTASVKAAILAQRLEELFGRDQGVMIGDGQLWFDHACRGRNCARSGPVRITAINR